MFRITQGEFIGRKEFGRWLTSKGLLGIGAEIGVHQGDNALQLLKHWNCKRLLLVDPYTTGYSERDCASNPSRDRVKDYKEAKRKLERYILGRRVCFLKCTSNEAARQQPDASMDFVYIDGNHEKHAVRADLLDWWPKITPGGVLAGHDIVCPGEKSGGWELTVQPEVLEFAMVRNLVLHLVIEEEGWPWSWYIVK